MRSGLSLGLLYMLDLTTSEPCGMIWPCATFPSRCPVWRAVSPSPKPPRRNSAISSREWPPRRPPRCPPSRSSRNGTCTGSFPPSCGTRATASWQSSSCAARRAGDSASRRIGSTTTSQIGAETARPLGLANPKMRKTNYTA